MAQSELEPRAVPLRATLLAGASRAAALEHLLRDPLRNLLLIDLVEHVGGETLPSEVPPQVLGAFEHAGREDRSSARAPIRGVAALRPSLVLEAAMSSAALAAFLPYFQSIESGLVKSPAEVVTRLWHSLAGRGRRAAIDRIEYAHVLPLAERPPERPLAAGACFRRAELADLELLVHAARASLREEDRPDPFDGDPAGFRRWVRGRLPRARVVEVDGEVGFVGYIDVRRREGWLVQGVYTWPALRRRGLAGAGMAGILREAFAAGADHVQLAVVAGNGPALSLYEGLGFRPFDELRTILFH